MPRRKHARCMAGGGVDVCNMGAADVSLTRPMHRTAHRCPECTRNACGLATAAGWSIFSEVWTAGKYRV